METKHPIKSKTINLNAAVGAIFTILDHYFGIKVPPDAIIATFGIGNILLRFITKGGVSLKRTDLETKALELMDKVGSDLENRVLVVIKKLDSNISLLVQAIKKLHAEVEKNEKDTTIRGS